MKKNHFFAIAFFVAAGLLYVIATSVAGAGVFVFAGVVAELFGWMGLFEEQEDKS